MNILDVAIIGCGKIADSHLEQLRRIPGCRVTAACDREPLMARQLCDRFKVAKSFSSVTEMLKIARPDVVHITTPPGNHFDLGKQCLEAGCHVYVEKPFTIDTREARELLALADTVQRKVTVGHDLQFSHVSRRLRGLVREGYLGGEALHIESYYCYDLSDARYARALLADKNHWVRRLPGKLLQNVISHGIARIAEHFPGSSPEVIAHGYTSPLLRSLGETEIIDELRVTISDGQKTTAYFTFSSQMRPSLNQFRVYGPKNGLIADEDSQTLIRCPGNRLKSYAEKFIPPFKTAGQYCSNVVSNLRRFLGNDFHMKAGMKFLFEEFYRSIREGAPPPISHREILLTSHIMDSIFSQLTEAGARGANAALPEPAEQRESLIARS